DQLNYSPAVAKVNLKGETTIPNKDFVLRYDVTGKRIEDALIAHRSAKGGFFTLVLQPPDKVASEDRTPKEIVFVLDTSGSMGGFPIEKAKEAMKLSLDGLYPEDTFNLITFAGDTEVLFETPVPATQANLELAQDFLSSRNGGGGTEMMKAIKTAFAPSGSKEHLRIVCFMTDGYVGNEDEIVAEIQRNTQARVFSFGIGDSVNRALLDKMAEAGKGEVEYVMLTDDGSKAAKRFYERVRSPLLTDLSIEWNGMPVADVYPSKLSDLFSAKPVIVKGRYTKGARGTIKLKGTLAGAPYERSIDVTLPEAEPLNDSLASLWARQRIDELSSDALNAKQPKVIEKQITDLGLEFGLMTRFTSFVAVEERIVNQNGTQVKMEVPVEAPSGVDMTKAGGFQVDGAESVVTVSSGGGGGGQLMAMSATVSVREKGRSVKPKRSGGSGVGYGSGSGSGSGRGSGSPALAPPPPANNGQVFSSATSQTVNVTGGESEVIKVEEETPFRRLEVLTSLQRPPAISYGVVNGKALSLPVPEYPAAGKAVGATGTVSVYVQIDREGKVSLAQAISGHPLLRASAVAAAQIARFTPTVVSGNAVITEAVLNYDFVDPLKEATTNAAAGNLAIRSLKSKPPTEADLREVKQKTRLHTWLYAAVQRIEKKTSPTPYESTFVHDGRASVALVFSTAVTPTLLNQLKALGFEVGKSSGSAVIGTIAVEKLRDLADIYEIKYVMPRML
ncbi:MAG: TonB family protein, partial [Pyrinomonadaceae bacterium]